MSEEIKEEQSFEEKVENAKELLEKLANPDITLSSSVEIYKNGMKELDDAQKLLETSKLQFKELSEK
ncbi:MULTISPECIES: exodeoxyribonuclease VII small subunit [unclassified Arcobacter]|jgi:exodeoxyribonuclease VII small subunit|uniref:exodeoxyribonuclease VII small subunit n=1 Tax=Arcobacter TaxID=28196 RepID=UPI0035D45DDB|tara:strand:- start:731 stop:931 length:201 start_codon:yes stop_codon:yes gene_type:complete